MKEMSLKPQRLTEMPNPPRLDFDTSDWPPEMNLDGLRSFRWIFRLSEGRAT